jgi:hypothetical protein
MTQQQFLHDVFKQIGGLVEAEYLSTILHHAEELYEDGYTVNDACRTLRCREEVSPDMDEDVALKRMAEIGKKYPRHQQRIGK